jgi:hypothetical protein
MVQQPSGLTKFVGPFSDTCPDTLGNVITFPVLAGNEIEGGKIPPPGAKAIPAPNMLDWPLTLLVPVVCADKADHDRRIKIATVTDFIANLIFGKGL